MSKLHTKSLNFIKKNKSIYPSQLATYLSVDWETSKAILDELVEFAGLRRFENGRYTNKKEQL